MLSLESKNEEAILNVEKGVVFFGSGNVTTTLTTAIIIDTGISWWLEFRTENENIQDSMSPMVTSKQID